MKKILFTLVFTFVFVSYAVAQPISGGPIGPPQAAGGGAPVNAQYYVGAADLTLTNEIVPSADIRSLLGAADDATARIDLGLQIGNDVHPFQVNLLAYAAINPSANVQAILGAANYAAMRTLLDLEPGVDYQIYDADLTTYAGITPSANVQTLLGSATFAAFNTNLGLGTGDSPVFTGLDLTGLTDNYIPYVGVGALADSPIQTNGTEIAVGQAPVVGSLLSLPLQNDPVTPTISFGDGDTGFYQAADGNVTFAGNGVAYWAISGSGITSNLSNGPSLRASAATGTSPSFRPNVNDSDTGIGAAAVDQLSLIAGGVEGCRITENTSIRHTFTGILENIPQAKTYNAADDAETIGTDLTSSIILITTDNDGADEEVDIQNGTAAGQMITFICVSGCDGVDDGVDIDVEEDSTCTGCDNAGIYSLGTNGDSVTIVWDHTNSTWYEIRYKIQ